MYSADTEGAAQTKSCIKIITAQKFIKPEKVGEFIETSGYSSIFPPGIFVGRIRTIHNAPDGVTYRLDVTLGTDFGRLRDVTVIATENRAEIDTLRVHALQSEQAI